MITFQNCLKHKKELPSIKNASSCLIAVYLQMIGKGSVKRHALICMAESKDLSMIKTLFEPRREDSNEKLRKQKRLEHKINLKRLRRKTVKLKKSAQTVSHINNLTYIRFVEAGNFLLT